MPDSDAESEGDSESFQQQLEELGGRLNVDSDRTGFLAMINRTHTFNSSAVSLGSILSLPSSVASGNSKASSFRVGLGFLVFVVTVFIVIFFVSCVGLCVHGFMNPLPSCFVCVFSQMF